MENYKSGIRTQVKEIYAHFFHAYANSTFNSSKSSHTTNQKQERINFQANAIPYYCYILFRIGQKPAELNESNHIEVKCIDEWMCVEVN